VKKPAEWSSVFEAVCGRPTSSVTC
jgi:hypothetical protein